MELLADVTLLPGEERIIGEFMEPNPSQFNSFLHCWNRRACSSNGRPMIIGFIKAHLCQVPVKL